MTRNSAPIVPDQVVWADDALGKTITLPYTDADGPGPYTFDIIDGPSHGTLGSDDGDATVVYTPTPGFIGTDSFTFRVGDGTANSGLATMSVVVQHYPDLAWETKTPAEVGLRINALIHCRQYRRRRHRREKWLRGPYLGRSNRESGLGVGGQARVAHAAVLRRAGEQITSLDDRIGSWVPAATGGVLRPEDEAITFAQLMNMTSGYAIADAPGAAWAYNDYASMLKNKAIGAIFGGLPDAPLLARLAPLKLQDGTLLPDARRLRRLDDDARLRPHRLVLDEPRQLARPAGPFQHLLR